MKLSIAQREALRAIVGRGDEDGRPRSSLARNGVRQPTLDVLEREGFILSTWVPSPLSRVASENGVSGTIEMAYVDTTDALLERHGLERSEQNPELWVTMRPGGKHLAMWFIGEPGKRWWGQVTRGGDQWEAKADTVFELIDNLIAVSEPEGER